MDKPWTVSHGPIVATEFDVQKAEAIRVLLIRPIGILPNKPGDPIHPFALGLFNDIRALAKPDVKATALRRAVGSFVHSKRYYFASAQPGSMRHDIDGKPVEPLSTEDRLVAQQRFLSLKRGDDENSASSIEPAASPAPPSKTEQIRAALLRRDRQT
ncbi:ProQ/FINO family protein [Rhizobium azibense]|nr:ProQ/FINO family protein [Rhizobium azibense]